MIIYTRSPDSDDLTDEQLVEKIQQGKEALFTSLAHRYQSMVQAKASVFAQSASTDWDDFLQEGLLALYRAALTYQPNRGARFATYADRVVENACIDLVRKERSSYPRIRHLSFESLGDEMLHAKTTDSADLSLEDSFDKRKATEQLLQQFRSKFSDYEFQVLTRYLVGLTYDEIATQLSTNSKSVDNALQRIRRKLRP